MIHSTYHRKDTNEDPKTSTVFELLLLLPDEVVWDILRSACFDGRNMPPVAGRIESYQFWPHWISKGSTNALYVEPDVFIRFQLFDLIIEAKYGECSGQYRQQWENEIIAYHNEFASAKPVCLIAVGGNADKTSESFELTQNVMVHKCTWLSLLIQVTRLRDEIKSLPMLSNQQLALERQLELIELGFNIHGVYNIHWFNELPTQHPRISPDSLNTLKTFFR